LIANLDASNLQAPCFSSGKLDSKNMQAKGTTQTSVGCQLHDGLIENRVSLTAHSTPLKKHSH
jgi:hypothetical protein